MAETLYVLMVATRLSWQSPAVMGLIRCLWMLGELTRSVSMAAPDATAFACERRRGLKRMLMVDLDAMMLW